METVPYDAYVQEALRVLPQGAFLTVEADGEVNTMTIGWGNIGYIWGKPSLMVMVRHSRYTYQLLEKADNFTVSFPLNGQLQEELNFCGTKSGCDYDKFASCELETIPGQQVETPLIAGCDLHYECRVKFKQIMDEDNLAPHIDEQLYPQDDYHTLYYGEIVACHRTE